MKNLSVIIRRVLRKGIKTGQGLEGVVAEMMGDDWQMMLSSAHRSQRDGLVEQLTQKIQQKLAQSSFANSLGIADTNVGMSPTVMS